MAETLPLEQDVAHGGRVVGVLAVELDQAAELAVDLHAEAAARARRGHVDLEVDELLDGVGREVVSHAGAELRDPAPDARPGPGREGLD